MTGRVLLVSNRLPVQLRVERERVSLTPSAGGLAVGLRKPHEDTKGLWIGWPGDISRLDGARRRDLDRQLEEARLVPIHLTPTEIDRYYEGFANGVLWPLFHYMPDRMPLEASNWATYSEVNARFADVVAGVWRPGDLVWVHDYHLLLLPGLLRQRLPAARIGLFLHIPFPSSEVFRILPWREAILEGMLGADVLGFHTFPDLQNFLSAVLRIRGLEPEVDHVVHRGRRVQVGAFPMGIDAETYARSPGRAEVDDEVGVRRLGGDERLVLGVDRLDYTKGIPRRLLAFERLLERHPRWRRKVRLIQVAVPSRDGVPAYQEFRSQVEALVGRINGRWGTIDFTPVQLLHRSFDADGLVSLYRAADVLLVTSLRDGMNLVAKEFAASRTDEDGVLILSEFAGAAAELGDAVLVNPHDVDAMALACHRALTMSPEERGRRMRSLRAHVFAHGIEGWVQSFLRALSTVPEIVPPRMLLEPSGSRASLEALEQLLDRVTGASRLALLLDHDGTLVPLAPAPELAAPDAALLDLLARLSGLPGTSVHIVSGRDRGTLTRWYGDLPLALHAEHGAAFRAVGSDWSDFGFSLGVWRPTVLQIMESFAQRTPGSRVEDKGTSIAWHYRQAEIGHGTQQARELRYHLRLVLANAPLEVMTGAKVVEVRPQEATKGRAVQTVLTTDPGAALLAIGDDLTDEDMFAALPEQGIGIVVGERMTRAGWRLLDVAAVRALLGTIAAARGLGAADSPEALEEADVA